MLNQHQEAESPGNRSRDEEGHLQASCSKGKGKTRRQSTVKNHLPEAQISKAIGDSC